MPNFYRIMALSSQARKAHLGMSGALEKGDAFSSDAQPYCASSNRDRRSGILSVHAHAAVSSAATLIRRRGEAATEELDEVAAAGYGEDEIVEIILQVALNTWTLNNTAATDIDSRSLGLTVTP